MGDSYFTEQGVVGSGTFVTIERDLEQVELAPGLTSRPLVGERMLASFVHYEPGAVAPLHAHEEEQIFIALEGELELTIGPETRIMRPGDAAVIPSGASHGARPIGGPAAQLDMFSPPRAAMLDLLAAKRAGD